MLVARGFRMTANGFSTHYTWNSEVKAYVCDDDPDYRMESIPKIGRAWVQVDEEEVVR